MCGITGIIAFTEKGRASLPFVDVALATLGKRGPDHQAIYQNEKVALGHARLSILDTSAASHQPFSDVSKRYTLIFNGEIYNFQSIRKRLIDKGHQFETSGDTEVLLKGFIEWDLAILEQLNGFFAFAIYDQFTQRLVIARDRIGIKPLLVYQDADRLIFGSEMKAMLAYQLPKKLDHASIQHYFQLTYIPSPWSIFEHIQKIPPGTYWDISSTGAIQKKRYYQIPRPTAPTTLSYNAAQEQLRKLLEKSVQRRMIADVPLGIFLSGGIDSSVITAIASQQTTHLNTFSIGFKNEPHFDETEYAELVARKFQTQHTVLSLNSDDFSNVLFEILDYVDEPFADTAIIPLYILCQHTRQQVTVALSGDGGDELLAGYNKHGAAYRAMQGGLVNSIVKHGKELWPLLPQSRASKFSNIFRQVNRFSQGLQLAPKERYWQWAAIQNEVAIRDLLVQPGFSAAYFERKDALLEAFADHREHFEDILYTDMQLVLVGDMLFKTDIASMANSLEVRTPFLDHELVNFAFQLPTHYKIDAQHKKKILQDAYRSILPPELYQRPKKGFDVPMLKWIRHQLKDQILHDWLSEDFIRQQGIFNWSGVQKLLQQVFSKNPGDSAAIIWMFIVFQYWWKKHL